MQFCFVHYTASDHTWIISEIGLLLETDRILDAIPASDCLLSPSALKIRNHLLSHYTKEYVMSNQRKFKNTVYRTFIL